MTTETRLECDRARIAIAAYKKSKGTPEEGLEIAIDLLADLLCLLRHEGAVVERVVDLVHLYFQDVDAV